MCDKKRRRKDTEEQKLTDKEYMVFLSEIAKVKAKIVD